MPKRTPLEHVYYLLKLYLSVLSLRKTSNILHDTITRNYVFAWISVRRRIFVAEQFLKSLIKRYGKRPVPINGGSRYPRSCTFLGLVNYIHTSTKRVILSDQSNTLKIESKSLMIIFL